MIARLAIPEPYLAIAAVAGVLDRPAIIMVALAVFATANIIKETRA